MVPVDSMLAALGRCPSCKQPFENDEYYFELGLGTAESPALAVCLGCSAQLLCVER
jgi:hypothetical protein